MNLLDYEIDTRAVVAVVAVVAVDNMADDGSPPADDRAEPVYQQYLTIQERVLRAEETPR